MKEEWFDRLIEAVEAHEDSRRAISLRAGLADSYIQQMVTYRKHPTVSRFVAICQAINKDPVEILTGVKQANPEVGRALQVFASWPDDQQKRFLDWIETVPSPNEKNDKENQIVQADPSGS